MLKNNDIDRAIMRLRKKGYLREFINQTFNYKIEENDKFDFHLQKINEDAIMYIYERREKNLINAYEFIDKDNDVYMEKSIYQGVILNKVYIKKCIKMYEKNLIIDNLILFVAALNSDNSKGILLEYLDKKIVEEFD